MYKLLIVLISIVTLSLVSCKQDTSSKNTPLETNQPKVTTNPPQEQILKKIRKPGLSQEELAKLTRFRDSASRKFGYKNEKGKVISPAIYDAASSYREGDFARVMRDRKYGFVNLDGKEVIPVQFEDASLFSEGLAAVKKNGKWGYIESTGKFVVEPKYDFTLRFTEGLSSVQLGSKWGYINTSGKEIIPLKYDATGYFNEGLCNVQKSGRWGYVDGRNKIVIPFQYEKADPFGMSLKDAGRVRKEGKSFYINKSGVCVRDCPDK